MPAENCFVCGVKRTELRTVHVGGTGLQLCSQCRWKREHKCLVKGCTTPASKMKLKSLPGRLLQATEVVRGEIFSQFGMQPDLRQCCKSCFTKLHRTIAEFSTNSSRANTCTAEKLQNKKGRPSVSFENASTKTKKRIEKKAQQLLNKTLSDLKDNFSDISGGWHSLVPHHNLQNITTPRVQTTKQVKSHNAKVVLLPNPSCIMCYWI